MIRMSAYVPLAYTMCLEEEESMLAKVLAAIVVVLAATGVTSE